MFALHWKRWTWVKTLGLTFCKELPFSKHNDRCHASWQPSYNYSVMTFLSKSSWPSLRYQLSHLTRRKLAFPSCIVEPWNKLPPEVVESASDEIFKRRLDGVWDTVFVPLPSLDIQQICFLSFVFSLCTNACSWLFGAQVPFSRPLNILSLIPDSSIPTWR